MPTNRIIIEFGHRKVYWNMSDQACAIILQQMVQSFGPATEDKDGSKN